MRIIYCAIIAFLLCTSMSLAQKNVLTQDSGVVKKGKLLPIIATESALYAGSMAYLQFIWYKDHQRVHFHYYNDNAGYLQIDKFGHTFGSYLESYIGYHLLRGAGVKKKQALIYGATLGIVLQTPIEVFDGMYEGWGFSWGDMIANTAGSALVIGQELLFDEQIAKMKFSFWRSAYAKQANGYLGENSLQSLFYDYNGHTYWLSVPMNKFIFKNKLPHWAIIAVGNSANGMFGEFENKTHYRGVDIPQTNRERQFILSLDVDWTRIKTNSKVLRKVFKGMFFVKMPFPALEITSGGKIKGHLLYF
jgi:uncharacterized protein YfiM (DUF2279 family)